MTLGFEINWTTTSLTTATIVISQDSLFKFKQKLNFSFEADLIPILLRVQVNVVQTPSILLYLLHESERVEFILKVYLCLPDCLLHIDHLWLVLICALQVVI
jgi:hypothetical protein